MNRRILISLLAVVAVVTAIPAAAQTSQTGSISGTVMYNDAGLPGVTIQISSPALQGDKVVISQSNGDFISPFLPPGEYTVTFSLEGFKTQTAEQVKVSNQQVKRLDVFMVDESFEGEIEVVGAGETISQNIVAQTTVPLDFQEKLAVTRTIESASLLVPGVNDAGINGITISGAQSFENLWLINGVVVNENVRGQSLPIYIEDAVLETTTSTSGVSAEYGRFQGGVVNMLTKSGGNQFSGSFRANLSNDKWVARTELSAPAVDDISTIYEATFGGYVLKDALWFFAAARDTSFSESRTTDYTLIPYTYGSDNQRYEGKLTWSITKDHRIVGSYAQIESTTSNSDFGTILDLASLNPNRKDPQDMWSANYTGVITENFFIEGLFSQRNYDIGVGSGSPYTDVIGGTLLLDRSRGSARYHTPTFCSAPSCQEEQRNNENWYIKGSYFFTGDKLGTHDLVVGYDEFHDYRIQDNHQQGSDYRIYGSAAIILDDNSIYPVFSPVSGVGGGQTYYRWTPIFGPPNSTDFTTESMYANDTWRLNNHWSFNVGVRYDKNHGVDGSGELVANDSRFTPRLGVAYDLKADGDFVINASYSQYTAALANTVADSGSDAGQPAWTLLYYTGPAVNVDAFQSGDYSNLVTQDEAIQIWYDWFVANGGDSVLPGFNGGSFPGFTPVIEPGSLDSPYTDEWSLGFTKRLGNRGVVRMDYVYRDAKSFYIQYTEVGRVVDTGYIGDVDQLVVGNDKDGIYNRTYNGLHTNVQYRIGDRWDLGASWTYSTAKGNFDGETSSSGPVTGGALAYPEYAEASWNYPNGYTASDLRNQFRAWAVWDAISTKSQSLSASVLFNYYTGNNYSLTGNVDVSPYVTNPGYITPPATATYYFSERGSQHWDNIYSTDFALNYGFTIKGIQLFAQFDLTNAFNQQGQDGGNTTITVYDTNGRYTFNPFTETPTQGVNWDFGSSFGEPTSENSFQTPRTFRFSLGVRF
jgi:hypothetical protein